MPKQFIAILQMFGRGGEHLLAGKSSVPDHSDWVEVPSWRQHGRMGSLGSGDTPNPIDPPTDFACTISTNPAIMTLLTRAAANGTIYAKVVLKNYFISGSQPPPVFRLHFLIEFSDVTVTSCVANTDGETASLGFAFFVQKQVFKSPSGSGDDDSDDN